MTVPREGSRNGLTGTVTEHIVGAPVLLPNISSESCSVRVPRNVFQDFQRCHAVVGADSRKAEIALCGLLVGLEDLLRECESSIELDGPLTG